MVIEEDDAWWLPFWFDYPPEGLRAPWFNAMSQGLALSFFVRLHRVTGDDVHLRDGRAALPELSPARAPQGRRQTGRGSPMSPTAATSGWSTTPTAGPTTCSTPTCTRSSGSTSTGSTRAHRRHDSCWRVRSRRCVTGPRALPAQGQGQPLWPAQSHQPLQVPPGAHLAAAAAGPHDRRSVLQRAGRRAWPPTRCPIATCAGKPVESRLRTGAQPGAPGEPALALPARARGLRAGGVTTRRPPARRVGR